MKTLIFNGSPRKNGDTIQIINKLIESLPGEYKVIDTYYCNISPCVDCRWCREHSGCCVDDEMQELYSYIQECDNIIIASPIYFSELTGKLLDVGSRLQTYFNARYFRNETPIIKQKKGAVILVGGGDGSMDKAYDTARTLLRHMNVTDIFPAVYSHNTNIKSALEDGNMIKKIKDILNFINK
ncbi:MAG: flavodoxin family protein [Oscillospiraceae bacterium]|nr:flavodoxin family protein [Oscillospiraceae bacterium]